MPLVTSTEMFKKAYDGGYAIGAFNVNNMEIVQGITEACQEEHAPVILQVSKGARAYANHTYLVKLVEAAVECCPDIPIVLHLDHGPDLDVYKRQGLGRGHRQPVSGEVRAGELPAAGGRRRGGDLKGGAV